MPAKRFADTAAESLHPKHLGKGRQRHRRHIPPQSGRIEVSCAEVETRSHLRHAQYDTLDVSREVLNAMRK
jgi:hypothetical protein